MSYSHERKERLVSKRPYSTELPPQSGDWAHLRDYLQGRGLDDALAAYNGWYPSTSAGDDKLRVVIPAASAISGNRFWQARLMGSGEPRYQSPKAARGDALVAVWPRKVPWRGHAVVEGPMDALAAAMEGWIGLALMGLTPPDEAMGYLKSRLGEQQPVLLVTDGDQPAGMLQIMGRLVALGCRAKLTLVVPYPFKDLAAAPKEQRERLLNA